MKYRAARCSMIEGIFRQDKLLLVSGFFVAVLMCGFYVLDTGAHRSLYYLSLPFLLALVWRDRTDLKQDIREAGPVLGLGAAFLLFMVLSVVWSSTEEMGRYFDKAKLLLLISIPMLASLRIFRVKPVWIEICMAAMVGTAFFSGVYLVARADIFYQDATWRLHGLGRAENPVQCSLLYALAIAGTLTLKNRFRFQSLIGTVLVAVFLFIMIETQSRGPMVALLGTLAGLFFFKSRFSARVKLLSVLGGVAALCCVIFYYASLAEQTVPFFVERLSTGRFEIWAQARDLILASPVWGYGLASKFYYTYHVSSIGAEQTIGHAHSLYLSTLLQGGVIALLLLLATLGVALVQAIKHRAWMPFSFLLCGAILGLFDFGGYVINLSTEWLVFWWPLVVLAAGKKYSHSS